MLKSNGIVHEQREMSLEFLVSAKRPPSFLGGPGSARGNVVHGLSARSISFPKQKVDSEN